MAWRTAISHYFPKDNTMNKNAKNFIKNIVYAVGANVSRIFTTLILTLLLPRLLSVEDYSFWQLYLFYGSYFIYSSIGWCEGTYLKYGGCEYKDLNPSRMAGQFLNMAIYEALIAFVIAGLALLIADPMKKILICCAALYMWMYILRYQLQTLLQATNRISEYARLYAWERFLYFIIIIVGLVIGVRSCALVIFAELLSGAVLMGYGIWLCKEITVCRPESVRDSLTETAELIRIGYKLTLAGLASQLIIGIVRFAIEQKWGTVTFGKISLSFSMANMMITCITAVSIVLFPMLKRTDPDKIKQYYQTIRNGLTIPMYGVLLGYVPMKLILLWWIPQYEVSVRYLAILFPLCIYEVRNSVLVWTYLKVLRKEALIMKANLVMIVVSLAMTGLSVYLLENLDLAVLSIVIIYALKALYTEWLLGKVMHIFSLRDWAEEMLLGGLFVFCSWKLGPAGAILIYLAAYTLYLLLRKTVILETVRDFKILLSERKQQ